MVRSVVRQTEQLEHRRRPPVGIRTGGLAHHEASGGLEEGRSALGRDRRRPERPGGHHVEATAPIRIPTGLLGATGIHDHPISEVERAHGGAQPVGSPLLAVEEDPPSVRPPASQHEAGDPTTRTQVETPGRRRTDGVGHALGLSHVVLERTRTEEPRVAGAAEHLEQGRVGGGVHESGLRGRTRRRQADVPRWNGLSRRA